MCSAARVSVFWAGGALLLGAGILGFAAAGGTVTRTQMQPVVDGDG